MSVTVKKLKLVPLGDKEEVNRVYSYIRDGQYNQALCMNSLMSQIGIAYFAFKRDVSDEGFKDEMKRIMRKENYIWDEYQLPKGLNSQSSIGPQLRSDFSTALKNGLARGKRTLPTYKLSYPLLVPGRLISIYKTERQYTNDDGELKSINDFIVKFPNKITFRVYLGSKGKRDSSLMTVLNRLADPDNGDYGIGGSSIYIDGKDIILNLSLKTEDKPIVYSSKAGRIMGLSFGYGQPCTAYISDSDNVIKIGSESFCKTLIEEREEIQNRLTVVQKTLTYARGGKGRSHKLRALERYHNYEKNVARTFNHKLSSDIVQTAVRNHVETIVFEKIKKDDFEKNPVMLRNWSFYQLQAFVKYKAKNYGILVLEDDSVEKDDSKDVSVYGTCSKCGSNNIQELDIPKSWTWSTAINYCCSCCNQKTEFAENKARNLVSILLNKPNKKGETN